MNYKQFENLFILKIILLIIGLYLATFFINKLIHFIFKKSELLSNEKGKTVENLIRSILNYVTVIIVILYIVNPFIDVSKLLAGAGVLGLILGIALQNIIKDVFVGIMRISEKQFHVGDYVTINNLHAGTVVEVGIRFLSLRKGNGSLLTISHGDVKEIENRNREQARVIEKITISYQENPDRIKELLNEVCQTANERYSDYLLKNNEGEAVEAFQFSGITNLNTGTGYEYGVAATVEPKHYWDATKLIRFEIAKALNQKEIRISESNIYSRARLTTKA